MRIANLAGRLAIVRDGLATDVEQASGGRFGSDPQAVYVRWHEFAAWAASVDAAQGAPYDPADLGSPAPCPGQVFAIGLNYRAHADESNMVVPKMPAVFTKFRSAISGPYTDIELPPDGHVDWEVELVVVIGRTARRVPASQAWSYVAGVTAGQDVSERVRQLDGGAPQFSLGKSFPGFAPMGPELVTIDELDDPDDLELTSVLDGEVMQHGRTSQMIFDVGALIEHLSGILELSPGDVIFTGTPSGVGAARQPPRFIRDGETLVSRIEGIGELRQHFLAARP